MGIEPTWDSYEPHTGFEDQGHHQEPVTSVVDRLSLIVCRKSLITYDQRPTINDQPYCNYAVLGYSQSLIKYHSRRSAERDGDPGGFVDFFLRKALFAGLFEVAFHARLATSQNGQRNGDGPLGLSVELAGRVGGLQKIEEFPLDLGCAAAFIGNRWIRFVIMRTAIHDIGLRN